MFNKWGISVWVVGRGSWSLISQPLRDSYAYWFKIMVSHLLTLHLDNLVYDMPDVQFTVRHLVRTSVLLRTVMTDSLLSGKCSQFGDKWSINSALSPYEGCKNLPAYRAPSETFLLCTFHQCYLKARSNHLTSNQASQSIQSGGLKPQNEYKVNNHLCIFCMLRISFQLFCNFKSKHKY